jgi:hypothetical protein
MTMTPRERSTVLSLATVLCAAVVAWALRFALWAANVITLWYLYGWATVKHDHLRIVRVKPDLVVSNGDVLKGIGGYHYFVGVAIWLPLGVGLVALIFYTLVPREMRAILMERSPAEKPSGWVFVIVLPLVFLVTAGLPMNAAMTLATLSAIAPLVWMRRICSQSRLLG